MKILTFDTETTTFQKGNPYSEPNRMVCIGLYSTEEGYHHLDMLMPTKDDLDTIQRLLDSHDLIVGFNLKFDLSWIRRYGIDISNLRVWDCQLVQFILSGQTEAYPSLAGCCELYKLGSKLDVVKLEYWDKGIDTDQIPLDILREYCQQDVMLTYEVYRRQARVLSSCTKQLQTLISLSNQDLLTLQEMEWNGILYNFEESLSLGNNVQQQVAVLDSRLSMVIDRIPCNWGSGDHLSAILYGGTIVEDYQEPDGTTYKTGPRAGQQRVRWKERVHTLPRLIEPLKGSELKKEGYYATNESTLLSLKAKGKAKDIIANIQERSKLEKLAGTYYLGIPKLSGEMQWQANLIHGQFNQVVARTGRLSSSKPNLQNMVPEVEKLMPTRFPLI